MEKELFIKELKNMKMIAHRLGYQMTKYPENSIEALDEIFKNKKLLNTCDGFEFDICFTKDLVPIVVHDKYVDDISNETGLFKNYTYEEISNFKFSFRKSIASKDNFNFNFKIITLDEILSFFNQNSSLLDNKTIRIETKDYLFKDNGGFKIIADIINKYPKINKNIIHISFFPFNLKILKYIQLRKNYDIIKTDLLCDYSILVFLAKYLKYIDFISLRIKSDNLPKCNKSYSKRMNKKIRSDLLGMKFTNVIREKVLLTCINKYGSVNLFTLSDNSEINNIINNISEDFFLKYKDKIIITTNEPNKYK